MKTKYCIAFAGVPGSSKSPITHHLSWNLGLPFFNNDILRTEVKEDLIEFSQDEYVKRRDDRGLALMDSGKSFIYDASVDREWELLSKRLEERGYESFIISLDLSTEFLKQLYDAKSYTQFKMLEQWQPEHDAFLEKYAHLVNLHITDDDFSQRLELSLNAVQSWIDQ